MPKISLHQRVYGQFFTPRSVVACCYELLRGTLPAAPAVVDPACGDGAFLRYAIEQAIAPPDRIAGCDVDVALVGALGAAGLPGVRLADGLDLESLPGAAFDLVIGNPPFGIAAPERPVPADVQASEVRFLLRALALARPGAHVALVLPSGVLANERLCALRAELVARRTILAIIALPRTTFRDTGTSAACSILLLRNAPAPPAHRVFFALPDRLDDLTEVVAAYHRGLQIADSRLQTAPQTYRSTIDNLQSTIGFWLPQTPELARRMDAPFWRPEHRDLLGRLAARHPLRSLGDVIDRRRNLIVGDHVRPSRGESKGPELPYEYYQTREFMTAGYNYASVERCDERAYRRLRRTAVMRHDILVSCAGVGGAGRGRVCLITHEPAPSCTGDVFILRTDRPRPIYLFLFLASAAGCAQLLRLQNGVGTANLSADELLQVMVPLPPDEVQRELAAGYASIAAAHDAAMAALRAGDDVTFRRERARSEALLHALTGELEHMWLGQ